MPPSRRALLRNLAGAAPLVAGCAGSPRNADESTTRRTTTRPTTTRATTDATATTTEETTTRVPYRVVNSAGSGAAEFTRRSPVLDSFGPGHASLLVVQARVADARGGQVVLKHVTDEETFRSAETGRGRTVDVTANRP